MTVGTSLKGTYAYDGLERLASRSLTNMTPSGTTRFIHMLGGGGALEGLMPEAGESFGGLGNRIIAESYGAGLQVREYVWLGDQVVAVIANANTSPTVYYVTNDHLGRPVQMIDNARSVVWRAKYRPFGEVSAITGAASMDLRWPGQWFQLESGLAYNWHRHYDASLGRYTQADPLGHPDGPSVYGYVGQNPAGGVDPQGLHSTSIPGGPGVPIFFPPWTIPGTPENRAWTEWCLQMLGLSDSGDGGSPNGNDPDKKPPQCTRASQYQLNSANITDPHLYKDELGARPNSKYDICACDDDTIVIKPHNQCNDNSIEGIETGDKWR